MSAYVIVDIEVTDPVVYAQYRERTPATLLPYGGRYLARGGAVEVVEGDWTPRRLVILGFPDVARAKAWLASPEYTEVAKLRHRSARTNKVLVEGV
jgi:uncharacterized protein (DUF1330 family)